MHNKYNKLERNNKGVLLKLEVLCLMLGALIRILYCLIYPVQPRDAYYYISLAEEIKQTGRIVEKINFYPLSIWLMSIPSRILDYNTAKGGIIVNLLFGLVCIVVAMEIAGKVFKKNSVALFIGLLLATNNSLIRFSCVFLRESIFICFTIISLYFLANYYIKGNLVSILGISIFGVLALMCRLEGIEICVLFIITEIFILFTKKNTIKKTIIHSIVFILLFFIMTVVLSEIMDFNLLQINYKTKIMIP
jgi:4-amino-4-deoxy-L-arabinose transferase-like glycosyltransferase